MAVGAAVFQFLEFLVRGDAGVAVTASDELGEGELLAVGLGDGVVSDRLLDFLEQLLGNQGLMFAVIPVAAFPRIFKIPGIEGVPQYDVKVSQEQTVVGLFCK